MEYLFVFKEGGWWLKISSLEELIEYHEQTNGKRYGNVLDNFIQGKEFNLMRKGQPTNTHMPHYKEANLTMAIAYHASNNKMSIIESISDYIGTIARNQLRDLMDYGAIFINRFGGYHGDVDQSFNKFVRRKQLVFPDFKENEIRVEQFPNGKHYYAYIGDTQVRDGDILKWDTYKEAYKKALEYIRE